MRHESSKDIFKKLKKDGWQLTRVKGSHHQFTHPIKPGTVTVQHPLNPYLVTCLETYTGRLGGIGKG